jgi:phage protein D
MDPAPIPIYEGQDFYVPAFEVRVGGVPSTREVIADILTVTYRDNIREIDSFEITINNWDAETNDFKYSDGDQFLPGKTVELWMGYFGSNQLRLMLTGEITSLRPSFPSEGRPTLVISGLNKLHRLRNRQESHSYQGMTDNQIAGQIEQRLRPLHVRIETPGETTERLNLFQDNQYDIVFLMERARRIGFDLFISESSQNGRAANTTLRFGPSDNVNRVVYELEYGRSLIEFQPELTTAQQVGQVTVRGWNNAAGEPITVTVTRDQITNRGVGRRGGQAQINQAFNEREEIIVDRPIASRDEAERLARQTLEDIAKEMVKGSGSVVGLPDLRAGSIVQITRLGTRFSGRYFVTATTHTIGDSGYTTRFDCRREEISDS